MALPEQARRVEEEQKTREERLGKESRRFNLDQ
uniref:Uncharacterized protein n=1 Tax=Peronospora matthiolae TaxID=2874970 RepID=A0AAV1TQ59_9STRA